MYMEYSYKFRIYPNKMQENLILQTFGCCRFVFNHYLSKRKECYEQTGKTLNYYDCAGDMTQLKQSMEWLKEVDSTALQSSLKDLDTAYQNFFRRVKRGEKCGYPRFKSKHNHRQMAKAISDAGWGEFCRQLEYESVWYGKKIVVIDRFYPSSQLCNVCGVQWSGTKDLSVREWTCPNCGAVHDRDCNAAKNILNEGLRLLA